MADIKSDYSSSATLTTTGLGTLANATSGNTGAIDNTTNKYLDYFVYFSITVNASAVASGLVEIWAKGSIDGTNYEDEGNDHWLASVTMGAAGAQTRKKVVSLATGFSGPLPPYVMIRIKNASGGAFTAISASYIGVQAETV